MAFITLHSDYKHMMHYIDAMLAKDDSELGSIILGKKYALYYKQEITTMLASEKINTDMLEQLQTKVRVDLEFIRKDCEKRMYYSQNVADNDYMMSMILDFILSL